ncbi:(2Fe-2S)-binding protein [Roseibium sp. M-1]
MFKRINAAPAGNGQEISFLWNGRELTGRSGDTVAAALIGAGVRSSRIHPVTDEPRAPFCMMGTCFECLVEVDGIPNRQACQVRLTEGMRICTQRGARK